MAREISKICKICEKPFRARRDAKTCSPTCRKRLERSAKRSGIEANVNRFKDGARRIEGDVQQGLQQIAASLLPEQVAYAGAEGLGLDSTLADEVAADSEVANLPEAVGSRAIAVTGENSEAQMIEPTVLQSEFASTKQKAASLAGEAETDKSPVVVSTMFKPDKQSDDGPRRPFRALRWGVLAILLLLGAGVIISLMCGKNNHDRLGQLNNTQQNQIRQELRRQTTINNRVTRLEVRVNALDARINNLKVSNVTTSGSAGNQALGSDVTLAGNTFNGPNQLVQLTANGLLPVLNGSNLTAVNAITLQGNSASYYTNASNLNSGTINAARLPTNVAFLDAANVFSAANIFQSSLAVQGSAGLTVGVPGSLAGSIHFANASGNNQLILQGLNPGGSGNATVQVPSIAAGTTDMVCLATLANCGTGGSAVTSLDGQTGALTLANSTGVAGTITINNAAADGSTKGIATFNATNFTAAAGVINTIQGIAVSSSPTFAGLTLSSSLTVPNGGTGANTLALNGILYGNGTSPIQATSAAANSILATNGSNVPSLTQTLPTAVQGNITGTGALTSGSIASGFGSINIGSNSITSGTINGQTISSSANFTGTLAVTTLGASGNTPICLNGSNQLGTCGANAAAVTLQQAYNASTIPQIVLTSGGGALTVQDAATPIGGNLLAVQSNGGGTTYLGVTASGANVGGNLTVTNANPSLTQTNFTQALTNSGINVATTFTDGAYTPGLFFSTQDNNPTKPKAGIYLQETGIGTNLLFGTSNSYATGITNTALTINPSGGAVFRNGTDSAAGFTVQNSGGSGLLTVNTSTGIVDASQLAIDVLGTGGTSVLCYNGSAQVSTCNATAGNGNYIFNGTATQTANFNIQSSATGSVAAVIQGASGQSVDLLDVKDGGGNTVASVGNTGNTLIKPSTNSTTAFAVQNTGSAAALNVDTTNLITTVRAGTDTATLGSNLITTQPDGTWSGTPTNWTTSAGAATHVTGNTTALSTSQVVPTAGSVYEVSYTVAGTPANGSTLSVTFGGQTVASYSYAGSINGNATDTKLITATNGNALTFTPNSTFQGIISAVSVQLVSPNPNAALIVKNASGTANLEVRASSSTTNTFIGLSVGQSNSTGTQNVALGTQALQNNTTGISNSAVGYQALQGNVNGTQNVALGTQALQNNTNGFNNSALGYQALQSNTVGSGNTAVGNQALQTNVLGTNNTAVGTGALKVTTSNNNTAIGGSALTSDTTGTQNTAIGLNALRSLTTGTSNTAIGFQAGFTNNSANAETTGASNTFIGVNSGPGQAAYQVSGSTTLGAQSTVNQSSAIILGCTNGVNSCGTTSTVGIGSQYAPNALTVSPSTYGTNGTAGAATTITESGTTGVITGSGTTFTTSMVGGTIYYSDGTTGTISTFTSTTSLTATTPKTVSAGSTYTIVYGGFNVTTTGTAFLQPSTDSTTAFQIQNAARTTTVLDADTTNARIGIGNNAPAFTLDVTGDINSSTGLRVGGTTVCTISGCTAATGSGNYIQNGTATQTANFNVQSSAVGNVGAVIEGASGQTADLLDLKDGSGTIVQSTSATGNELVKPSTNSTTAFQVQNAAGTAVLTADTSNSIVTVRGANSDSTQPGSNLITISDFCNATWTTTGWTLSPVCPGPATSAIHTTGNTSALSTSQITVAANTTYTVFSCYSNNGTAGATITTSLGGVSAKAFVANGGFPCGTVVITTGASPTNVLSFTPSSTWTGTIANVSVLVLTASNSALTVQNSSGGSALEVRSNDGVQTTVIGLLAGQYLASGGSGNTAIGAAAMQNSAQGFASPVNDTAIGANALQNDNTGGSNTAVGYDALQNLDISASIAPGDTALGSFALQNTTSGGSDVALGSSALQNNTSGSNNVAVGYQAGLVNTTGNANTFIGYNTNANSGSLANMAAIGAFSQVNQSNSLVLGCLNGTNGCTTSTKVGISHTAPAFTLDVGGDIRSNGTVLANGGAVVSGLAVPAAPTITQGGTTGATNYSYAIAAVNANGGSTLISTATQTTTGNATLTGTNFNKVTWTAVIGVLQYKIYRTASSGTPSTTGLIGTVSGSEGAVSQTFNDTGIAATTAAPTVDTSGQLTVTGTALFQNAANSTGSFQIQDAAGTANLFDADTSNGRIGIGTLTPGAKLDIQATTNIGLNVNETGSSDLLDLQQSAANVVQVTSTGATLFKNSANSTTAFRILDSGNTSLLTADTTTDTLTVDNLTVSGVCTGCGSAGTVSLQSAYTAGATITTTNAKDINFTLADTATDSNFLVNAASGTTGRFAVQAAGTDTFSVGATGAVLAKNSANSAAAFQVQNAAGTDIFTVDTSNGKAGTADQTAGSTNSNNLVLQSGNVSGATSNSGSVTLDSGSATGTAGNISIGTGAYAHNVTVGNITGASAVTIQGGTGAINIGTQAVADTITIGNSTGATSLVLNGGTGAINIGTQAVADTITIGNSTGASSVVINDGTGALSIGTNAIAHTITLGNSTGATSLVLNDGTGALSIGTNAIAHTITLGNVTGATSVVVNCGTGACSFGTSAIAHTTTVGSTTGAATTTIQAGTGGINVGNDAIAKTITIGNTTGATAITLQGGTGGLSLTTQGTGSLTIGTNAVAQTIGIGNATGATAVTVDCGTGACNFGTTATDHSTTLGSTTGVSATTIQGGTGGITLSANTTLNGTLTATGSGNGTTTYGALFKNASNSTTAFQIQNSTGTALLNADTSGMTLTVQALVVSVNLTVNGHIITGGGALPAATPQTADGTTGACTVVGNDTAGTVTITPGGTGIASGAVCQVNFTTAFGSAPRPVIVGTNAAGSAVQAYVSASATGSFTISFNTTPSAQAYTFNWFAPQ